MNDEQDTGAGIGRRSLIKRAGIVGAGVAAWSAPSVTSLASRAYAGSAPAPCTGCQANASNGQFPTCGTNGSTQCFCVDTVPAGSCACVQVADCGPLQTCGPGAQACPPGYSCVSGNNFCGRPVCAPNCDTRV